MAQIVAGIVIHATGVVGSIISVVGVVALLVAYVMWRRRRNRALTGSPTRWPDADL